MTPRTRVSPSSSIVKGVRDHEPERERLLQEIQVYREAQLQLLDLERATTQRTLRDRRSWTIGRLCETGQAMDGLTAYWRASKRYGQRVAVFARPARAPLGWSRFSQGDLCELFPSAEDPKAFHPLKAEYKKESLEGAQEKKQKPKIHTATVLSVAPDRITLLFDNLNSSVDLEGCASWTLMQGENLLVYKRTAKALDVMSNDLENQYKAPRKRADDSYAEYILSGTSVADALLGLAPAEGASAFAGDQRLASWVRRRLRPGPILQMEGDPGLGLNESQERAVATMLGNRLSLVQGPPGTGKTRTIVAAIQLLKQHFEVPQPILLCAHTNVAVDNLAAGALQAGLKVIRAGSSARTRSDLNGTTLDDAIDKHPEKPRLDQIRADVGRVRQAISEAEAASQGGLSSNFQMWKSLQFGNSASSTSKGEDVSALKARIMKLRGQMYNLEQQMITEALREADVVCCTAVASCSNRLTPIDFPVVFFDEGSMATEATSLIPLMKGCRHLALIGDHKQLPPVVTNFEARQKGASLSLFERLINRGDVPSTMLGVQHRMHPDIAAFPNRAFYQGALEDGEDVHVLEPLQSEYLPQVESSEHGQTHSNLSARVSFISHEHKEEALDKSTINIKEAQIVARVLADLLIRNPSLRGEDIGIVAPYAAQVRHFQQMLKQWTSSSSARSARDFLQDLFGEKHRARASQLSKVEAHTVDGFEGREKEAIIFSSTRAGEEGFVGFLADSRRLCVALTRAKRALFVVGNIETWRNARLSERGASSVESADVKVLHSYAEWIEDCGMLVHAQAEEELAQNQEQQNAPSE
ncbi:P-loop containing nucleoside triphosphate hydrolase protein [Ceraceosorus guamensis]|uniref:P-loop containing nucleoside triphosphate hydrolase protein n=1 Tax=Ceraceosorus guamensis TaxID=1522189 RepID=A0A316W4H7_9BASI|nr:P-loop containing nucleoside triphosphate hydrolase protein [Ceraceosorus guamensis]PWN44649.1 P-loop containing nucleoside triphosphate hydrolase protein [Ceraceosorus guamensis]